METWRCLNCANQSALNVRGRCGSCDSDSVVSMEANYPRPAKVKDGKLIQMIHRLRIKFADLDEVNQTVEKILTR